jgi:hypothetical protein
MAILTTAPSRGGTRGRPTSWGGLPVGFRGDCLRERKNQTLSRHYMFHCCDVMAALIPAPADFPYVDNEIFGQLGLGTGVHAIAHGAGISRCAASARPRPFPRPIRMGLADPAGIGASGAKSHQHPTSKAHKPEPNQHKHGCRRRDEKPAFYDVVHGPSPHASLTGGKSCAADTVTVCAKRYIRGLNRRGAAAELHANSAALI